MNREMPMAARSTSMQFNTCHPFTVKEENTHTRTRTATHGVPLVCLSFCLWAFVPNQAPGIFWESWTHRRGPLDCHMSRCRPIPITANWSKAKASTTLELHSPICIPVAYYIHTQTHSGRHSVQHMNISPLIKYSRKLFFLLFSVRIEIHCRLNWTLPPDCCNTP